MPASAPGTLGKRRDTPAPDHVRSHTCLAFQLPSISATATIFLMEKLNTGPMETSRVGIASGIKLLLPSELHFCPFGSGAVASGRPPGPSGRAGELVADVFQ